MVGARSHLRQLHRVAAPVRSHGVYLEPSGVACDEPFRWCGPHELPGAVSAGPCQIAVYFVVFTVLIKALDLPTPGRRPEEPSRPEKALPLDEQGVEKLIAAFGGRENIRTVDNCFTRLRVTVNGPDFVKEPGPESPALRRCGAKRLRCADRVRHPRAGGAAGGGAAAEQGGLLTFGGRATIIGKSGFPRRAKGFFVFHRFIVAARRQ